METGGLIMRNKLNTIAITGHRELFTEDLDIIRTKLKEQLKSLAIDTILVGDATGADQIAREVASELNIRIIDINLVVLRNLDEPEADYYARQAEYMIHHTHQLIAVWDGVFTRKPGGTSDIVYKALHSQKTFTIYHLVCRQLPNPYPVASLLDKMIDFEAGKFNRLPLALPFSWVKQIVEPPVTTTSKKSIVDFQVFSSFLIPGGLAILTLLFGVWGFSHLHPDGFINNFFRSLNLITFNNSVIESPDIGWQLELARLLGLLTATSAIGFAIYAATEKQRIQAQLKVWAKNKNFDLVLGLNQKSFDLLVDLNIHHQKNVVLVYSDAQSKYLSDIKKLKNVIAIQGNLYSATTLASVHAAAANKIYILGDSDTENIRAAQELDNLIGKVSDTPKYIHIEDESKKMFLINSLCEKGKIHNTIFNIYENTIRRLLLYYPLDRFYQNPLSKNAHAVILGFGQLGKTLTVQLLKQGHFARKHRLSIKVVCENAEESKKDFLKAYPQFDPTAFGVGNPDLTIMSYTWSNISLEFHELPTSDKDWLTDRGPIFSAFNGTDICNIYACLEDGIASAAILNTLLPKIEIKKQELAANVQVYCYYNFPDKKEETIIENYFNQQAPHTFVKCFGNYLDECSAAFIQDISLDALPKLINGSYDNSRPPAESWRNLTEKDKISNRQSADHLWTKIRLIWPKIDWKVDLKTFEPYDEVANEIFEYPIIDEYGEIEHRRWCADLLMQGFVPFDLTYGSIAYKEVAEKWEDPSYKKSQQIQKRHISLVPYKHLLYKDKAKDIKQIKAIPGFLRGVVKST